MVAGLVSMAVMRSSEAVELTGQVQTANENVREVADPLAALCGSDPTIRQRVGDACDAAVEAAAAPSESTPGSPGADGIDGRGIVSTVIDGEGHLIVSYTDGSRRDVGAVVGAEGAQGRGIAASTISSTGQLVLTFNDGTTQDVGVVVGQSGTDGADGEVGPAGRGVVATAIVDGRLRVSYTDGTTDDAGPVPMGERGADGSPAAELVINRSDGSTVRCPRTGGENTAPVYTCSDV